VVGDHTGRLRQSAAMQPLPLSAELPDFPHSDAVIAGISLRAG